MSDPTDERPLLPAVIRERIKEVADEIIEALVDNDHWIESTCESMNILAEDIEVPVKDLPSNVSTVAIRNAALTYAKFVFTSGAEEISAEDFDSQLEYLVEDDYPGDE